jgi:hypothetical protein
VEAKFTCPRKLVARMRGAVLTRIMSCARSLALVTTKSSFRARLDRRPLTKQQLLGPCRAFRPGSPRGGAEAGGKM